MGSLVPRRSRWPRTSRRLPEGELELRQTAAEHALIQAGITFNVYSDSQGVEKTLPFDLIPRIVGGTEWKRIERGLKQRITALNQFIDDLYHDQKILKDGVVPREIIASSKGFRQQCVGLESAARDLVPHHGHRPGAASATGRSTCWRTICAVRRASRTCWRTGG